MTSGTSSSFAIIILSNFLIFTYAQYYADNQYYFYQPQYQQQYWPRVYPSQQTQQPNYQPQQTYRQIPQAVVPPLQRTQYVPEKKPTVSQQQGRVVSANTYEFDLPPPPPSRFLPDEEKTKILSLNKQGRPEHIGQQQRVRLIAGATNATRQNQNLNQNQSPQQQVQIHHLQVPRLLQKTVQAMPAQMTHLIGGSFTSTQPAPTQTSTFQTFTITTQTPRTPLVVQTVTTHPPTFDHHFESETLTTKPVSHLVGGASKKINPNKIFLKCCLDKKVPKTCEGKCNFDNINKKTLTRMFLGSDPCPQSYGLDLFACAAQENDHTTCCKSKNVQRTSAGAKCLAFCNLRPESHFQADASYLPCWSVLHDIKNCFKDAVENGGPM